MKSILLILSLVLPACSNLVGLVPPAIPNPLIVTPLGGHLGIEPLALCAGSLTPKQLGRVQTAMTRWQNELPELKIRSLDPSCDHWPSVRVRDDLPSHVDGWTNHEGIGFKEPTFTTCKAVHEIGHWLGFAKHAPDSDPPGPMSNNRTTVENDRGDCLPTEADKAILMRTYRGRVSR